jgi:site-specific DNA-methyltransferase (adenine-specific)
MVFSPENFLNEVIWQRTAVKGDVRRKYGAVHDVLLFYTKGNDYYFESQRLATDDEYMERFKYDDGDGRGPYQSAPLDSPNPRPNLTYIYKGYQPPSKGWRVNKELMEQLDREGKLIFPPGPSGRIRRKVYLKEQEGPKAPDVWVDIPPLQSSSVERLGYPTQKPLPLLERLIRASSRSGDLVLDPFCGCGTAVHAAQKLGRNWIGIDITHLSIHLIERRMHAAFPDLQFGIHGEPEDLASARDLAERDKYEFQFWACSLVGAQPYKGGHKGADSGIDGILYFQDDKQQAKKIMVSVKGGEHVTRTQIADLKNTVEREGAEMGFFITLVEPTEPMNKEAISAGFYQSKIMGDFPKIQILTIEDLLGGAQPRYPDLTMGQASFKKARTEKKKADQPDLFD